MHSEVQSAAPMSDRPNAAAQTEDFEFAALAEAKNYRHALIAEFREALRGEVVAGIGQMTELLAELPDVRRTFAIEPDAAFCGKFRERLPQCELLEGTVSDLSNDTSFDAALCINVLEHIREDTTELARFAKI